MICRGQTNAVGVIISPVVSFRRRRSHLTKGGDITVDYLRTNSSLARTIALTVLFFRELLWMLNSDKETGDAVTSPLVYLPIGDALYIGINLSSSGRHLLTGR